MVTKVSATKVSASKVSATKAPAAKVPATKVPATKVRATKRNTVPDLQRELLMAGIKSPSGRLRFARSSIETLATTYAALISLQRKKLIEPEKQADRLIMSWKVTKAGRAALADKPGRR
jgi:hypothetical protein